MQRLVYAPKAFVYVRGRGGNIYDLTNYVVSGNVSRKVDQASTATVTLRNPQRIFTRLGDPAFLPMDPVTIFLQRLRGHPVRVFTGFLDETPYYQMYPGTCTITATCTLKKLSYTYWNPALPYVMDVMAKFGWQIDPANGILRNPNGLAFDPKAVQDIKTLTLKDGSIGALLFYILQHVGGWDPNQILIEKLPTSLVPFVMQLFTEFKKEQQGSAKAIEALMSSLIGQGSYGSGGSSNSGSLNLCGGSNTEKAYNYFRDRGFTAQQSAGAVGCMMQESGTNLDPTITNPNTGDAYGVAQWTSTGNRKQRLLARDNHDTLEGQLDFIWWELNHTHASAKTQLSNASTYATATAAWLVYFEGVSVTDPQAVMPKRVEFARGVYEAFKSNGLCSDNSNNNGNTGTAQRGSGGNPRSSASRNGGSTNSNGMINPIPGFTGFSFDKGIDCSAPVGSAIFAPADCTLVNTQTNFYRGQPLMLFKFDQKPSGAPSQYWFVSEQIDPVTMSHGRHFNQGDTVAKFAASGTAVEIGWGSPDTGDMRFAPVEAHYGAAHVGYGWHFYNYFSVGSGTPQKGNTDTGTPITGGSGTDNMLPIARAAAFATELQWPTLAQSVEAVALQGTKSLMDDQPLMPFVQQLCQATMRSFQSAPNGDFYAFFPDYFGEFHHRTPYWKIHDIEVIEGNIQLNDASLVTHAYVVGDIVIQGYPSDGISMMDKILSAGVMDIFNFFGTSKLKNDGNSKANKTGGSNDVQNPFAKSGSDFENVGLHNTEDTILFLQRYGVRPMTIEMPLVRSPFYEGFLALQQFMMAWANQFITPFTFTFMPELYPGGQVAFPDHGLTLYIQEVEHTFDYEGGFTTQAALTAPSAYAPDNDGKYGYEEKASWGMVNALTAPVHAMKTVPVSEKSSASK